MKKRNLKNKESWGLRRDCNRSGGKGGDNDWEVSSVNTRVRTLQIKKTSSQGLKREHAFVFELRGVRKFCGQVSERESGSKGVWEKKGPGT